jgi:hypothetical protein
MAQIAIAETKIDTASREIEPEDSGTLAQLKFVGERDATIPVGEARLEIKGMALFGH